MYVVDFGGKTGADVTRMTFYFSLSVLAACACVHGMDETKQNKCWISFYYAVGWTYFGGSFGVVMD
jgi:hypothetical protein